MANIKAFRGYRYNKEKITDFGAVIAPSHAIVTNEEKIALYEMHPNNAVRLVLGINHDTDTDDNNAYTRSASYLNEWIDSGILVKEEQPSIYLYSQSYEINEIVTSTKGFITMLKIEDYLQGHIMPCEEINETFVEHKYKLLETTESNRSMINCMYVEPEKKMLNLMNEIMEQEPEMDFTDSKGIQHRLWVVNAPETISFIADTLADKNVYIEDGQNRYEAALRYRNKCREMNPNHTGEEDYNYIMAFLTNAKDDGLVERPVHRLISFPRGFREEYIVAGLQDRFKTEKIIVDITDDEMSETIRKQIATMRKETKIAMYCGGNYFYRMTLKDPDCMKEFVPDKSEAYRTLDVTVFNYLILGELLNISTSKSEERVTYVNTSKEGIERVQSGEFGCLFLLNPVKSYQICEVALAGEKLPKRTLSIMRKPATGVVINKFDNSWRDALEHTENTENTENIQEQDADGECTQ